MAEAKAAFRPMHLRITSPEPPPIATPASSTNGSWIPMHLRFANPPTIPAPSPAQNSTTTSHKSAASPATYIKTEFHASPVAKILSSKSKPFEDSSPAQTPSKTSEFHAIHKSFPAATPVESPSKTPEIHTVLSSISTGGGLATSKWANSASCKISFPSKSTTTIPAVAKRIDSAVGTTRAPSPVGAPTAKTFIPPPEELRESQENTTNVVSSKAENQSPSEPPTNAPSTKSSPHSSVKKSSEFAARDFKAPSNPSYSQASTAATASEKLQRLTQTLVANLPRPASSDIKNKNVAQEPSPPVAKKAVVSGKLSAQHSLASIIANDSNNSELPSDQHAMAYQKYDKDKLKHKKTKPPYEKQPGGWLSKDERKAMAATNEDPNDMNGAVIPYNDGGFPAQPEIDWNASNQLLDWEGNILPPPVEWDGRPPCNRDNWAEFITDYIQRSQPYYVQKENGEPYSSLVIDMSHPAISRPYEHNHNRERIALPNGDIVPKHWITVEIENQTLQSFWKSLVQIVPKPVDEGDLSQDPFWLRYQDDVNTLKPIHHEDARCEFIDENDPDHEAARLYNQSRLQTSDTGIAEFLAKKDPEGNEGKHARRLEKEMRRKATKLAKEPKRVVPPNPHRPKTNVYLRPMQIDRDIHQVHLIYEHYANNTCYTPEVEAIDMNSLAQRLQWVKQAGLPLIVAVDRSGGKKSRNQGNSTGPSEKILGFAVADEDDGRGTQHSHVCSLEVFVHPQWQTKGIGKNLLERMLWLLDPAYRVRSDVLWNVNEDDLDYNTPGGKRVIGTVRVVLYYGEDERIRCQWMNEWLKRYDFAREADFSAAGIKLEKWTRQAIWQRKCNSGLDPKTMIR